MTVASHSAICMIPSVNIMLKLGNMAKANRWKSGVSEQMKPALEYAEKHGFETSINKGQHLEFKGHGVIVIGSANPRNHYGAKQAISRMKRAVEAAAAGLPPPAAENDADSRAA